jgi:hypothetical protein
MEEVHSSGARSTHSSVRSGVTSPSPERGERSVHDASSPVEPPSDSDGDDHRSAAVDGRGVDAGVAFGAAAVGASANVSDRAAVLRERVRADAAGPSRRIVRDGGVASLGVDVTDSRHRGAGVASASPVVDGGAGSARPMSTTRRSLRTKDALAQPAPLSAPAAAAAGDKRFWGPGNTGGFVEPLAHGRAAAPSASSSTSPPLVVHVAVVVVVVVHV